MMGREVSEVVGGSIEGLVGGMDAEVWGKTSSLSYDAAHVFCAVSGDVLEVGSFQ